ncbi:hypothetical protein SLEP1_g6672 [Rubroshorea leprosula]|uniref:Transposase-associated domain-containing protein n=1 Tax=Rubroshorea leprosula TaxID=152421 RepID=A0AAV5HWA4_9ROSI|nr:hypothetical protein SLEP1_g6672 [Rubroshorea leprosula]
MGYWNNEFNVGVEIFLDFAFSQTDPMFCAMNMIRCPRSKCWNREWHHRRRVQSHLITNSFMDGATGVEDATQFDASFDDPYGVSTESIFEELRGDAKEFFDLLQAADTPIFDGCDDGVTVLKWFLPLDHPFRRNKNDFIKGRTKNGTMLERLSGDEMRSRIHWLPDVLFGKPPQKQEINGFGEVHNWVKKSIFWELPYWHTNLI